MSFILSSVHQATHFRENVTRLKQFPMESNERSWKHFTLITVVNSAYHVKNRRETITPSTLFSSCLTFTDIPLHHHQWQWQQGKEPFVDPLYSKPIKICTVRKLLMMTDFRVFLLLNPFSAWEFQVDKKFTFHVITSVFEVILLSLLLLWFRNRSLFPGTNFSLFLEPSKTGVAWSK